MMRRTLTKIMATSFLFLAAGLFACSGSVTQGEDGGLPEDAGDADGGDLHWDPPADPGPGDPGPGDPDPSPGDQTPTEGHNAGSNCCSCHAEYQAAGTVFTAVGDQRSQAGIALSWTLADGTLVRSSTTKADGNIAEMGLADGTYLISVGNVSTRTWHTLPAMACCNTCHLTGGNGLATVLPVRHTRVPADNDCTHCHHYPASQSYAQVATEGPLHADAVEPALPASVVEIMGVTYDFDPLGHDIVSLRDDIFAPGFYSMFDVILAVASANGIELLFHYDSLRKTHFIDSIDGRTGNYWYRFAYDVGGNPSGELLNRRQYRWDEALWRPGVTIRVQDADAVLEDLDAIKAAYLAEIEREQLFGNLIPTVELSVSPSDFDGNPPASHRVSFQNSWSDLLVTAHNLRATGYPSPYSKPFQPGVVTSIDVLLSLQDLGELEAVSGVFYTHFAGNYIESYYVVTMGFPTVGTTHASGRQGFVYTTGNGSSNRMVNNAGRTFHITSDISVVHAPDFSVWRWIELGNPYYESMRPAPFP